MNDDLSAAIGRDRVFLDGGLVLGSGIGKIWMAPDAFSPETDLEIQKLFEADDPKFENLGPKPARKKNSK